MFNIKGLGASNRDRLPQGGAFLFALIQFLKKMLDSKII
jgi:hypothetical protein